MKINTNATRDHPTFGLYYTLSLPLFLKAYSQGLVNTMPLNIAAISIPKMTSTRQHCGLFGTVSKNYMNTVYTSTLLEGILWLYINI